MEEKPTLIKTPFDALTYKIIGCAMAVHRELRPGLRENTYQRALAARMAEQGIGFEEQKLYEVYDQKHDGQLVGYYIPDFVVEGSVVVEIKALSGLNNSHLAQIIGYLAISHCPLGLLINFGERSLRHRRILPPQNIQEHQVGSQWLFIPDWLKQA